MAFAAADGVTLNSGSNWGNYGYEPTEWGGVEVNCRRNDVCNGFKTDENGVTHNGAWLAPGQMEVFRIEE